MSRHTPPFPIPVLKLEPGSCSLPHGFHALFSGSPCLLCCCLLLVLGDVLAHFLQQAPQQQRSSSSSSGSPSPLKRWQWIASGFGCDGLDGYTPRHKPISPTFPRLPFLIFSLFFCSFPSSNSFSQTWQLKRGNAKKDKGELNSETTEEKKRKKKNCCSRQTGYRLAYFYICCLHSLVCFCLFASFSF